MSERRSARSRSVVIDRLLTDRAAVTSVIVIVLIVGVALLAPLIARLTGHSPIAQYHDIGQTAMGIPVGPNSTFLFGTDDLGRDVLVRVVYGARVSLLVAALSSVLAMIVGVVIGLTAGYLGGAVDGALSRFMDIVLSLPTLVFAIALVSVVGPSVVVSIIVIAFFSWAWVGRIVRGQTLSLRESEYVQAARTLGAGSARIMFVEILPNVMAPVIVAAALLIPSAIGFEAALSFLGLGVVPPTPSWGEMLADSIAYYKVAWWFVVFPGASLLATTVAFNVLGDSLRDAFDARSDSVAAKSGGVGGAS